MGHALRRNHVVRKSFGETPGIRLSNRGPQPVADFVSPAEDNVLFARLRANPIVAGALLITKPRVFHSPPRKNFCSFSPPSAELAEINNKFATTQMFGQGAKRGHAEHHGSRGVL